MCWHPHVQAAQCPSLCRLQRPCRVVEQCTAALQLILTAAVGQRTGGAPSIYQLDSHGAPGSTSLQLTADGRGTANVVQEALALIDAIFNAGAWD